MSDFKLNLPTDIPWKRKCVSQDMLDPKLCDGKFPPLWRSSIVVFEYEPDEELQIYKDITVSYLKISCTITGYQENPKEIGLDPLSFRDYWNHDAGIADYITTLQKYYACYGAILEVAIAPEDKSLTLAKFPYFLDFEPKKRELYELVTDTGESMSRSLSNIEIGKSNSSLKSREMLDVDKGWGASSGSADSGTNSFNIQGEWGTKDMTQEQSNNLKNTNTSQEMRETQSHTTQLSQLYHQLDSYHIGTNRAVFFIHPRPHTMETERTFVNGPRNIEGIQEFIFIVARDTDVKKICVEAYLETGHIVTSTGTKVQDFPGTQKTFPWQDSFSAQTNNSDGEIYDDKDRIWNVEDHFPEGYQIIDAQLVLGAKDENHKNGSNNLVDTIPYLAYWNQDFVKVSGKVHSSFESYAVGSNRSESIIWPFTVNIKVLKKQTITVETADKLFITGRGLCCCTDDIYTRVTNPYGIVWESPNSMAGYSAKARGDKNQQQSESMGIRNANLMGLEIKRAIIESRTDLENRYLEKGISIAQSNFAIQTLVNSLTDKNHAKIADLKNLNKSIIERVLDFNRDLTVSNVALMPIQMQQDLFDLTVNEAIELRKALVGLNHRVTDKRMAWLTPEQQEKYKNRQK